MSLPSRSDRVDQLRRDVVGMNVDRHAGSLTDHMAKTSRWERQARAPARRISAAVLRTALMMF